ncbi:hypothetical protein C8F04DRAFT_95088 [Mycena alexandri]|uniref:G domain-containing protein n=1 Tax=Mycena alexandri TaxID=1745969 RepID=A0AAD6WWC3_9AGAR|nr:hypothetical protein C8F04DRAFT_95088 [Mycena alexandri]
MTTETLPLESAKILSDCPRLRVLVVGKSGAGKSSLISFAFGVKMESVSDGARGVSDINNAIESPQNPRFVLHDSMGFEPGETENLRSVEDFLKARSGEAVPLKHQVHIIWLCIRVPDSGSRVFETGDEELLTLAFKLNVPVVVIFTQYDVLLKGMRLRMRTATSEQRELAAEEDFEELCLKPLQKAQDKETLPYTRTSGLSGGVKAKPDWVALDGLVGTTRDLIDKRFGGNAWIVSAMAQRTSVEEKVKGATAVGMKNYWQGLASSTKFPGSKLGTCLNTVHKEMTDSWNLYDPDDLLQNPEFVTKIRKLAQLVTPNESEMRSSLPNFDQIHTIVGIVVTAGVVAVVPTIAAIGLSLWFVNLLIEGYRNTPETLRCFMGYIVDLSLVMDQIFHITIARAARPLTDKDIDEALENYKNANLGAVHREIRAYAGKATIAQIIAAGPAEVKVNQLIQEYSTDLRAARGARAG